jgi:outer membrane protein assembly factor BamA
VPFYLMPAVGGNSSVRGYPSFRFRGNHRLLVSAEYRWAVIHAMDLAAFYDAGKVASAIDQLKFADLKWAYGVGARFHSSRRTTVRVEVARNDEGSWRFVWSTGAAF